MAALAVGACSDDDDDARVDRSDPTATGPATGPGGAVVPGCQPAPGSTDTPDHESPPSPYNGLGTWIDVFDFAPGYADGGVPAVGPEQVAVMHALGIKTIFLQAARNDESGLTGITEPDLVGRFLQAAHARGMCVVAWYLPRFADVDADWARLQAILAFEPAPGERFDGVGVDIEFRGDEANPAIRSDRLVQLSQRLRAAAPGMPLGAIVPPPVLMEVVNPDFWPDFPWKRIKDSYDVWMPMAYWTFRNSDDPYRDAFTYTDESIRRMRRNLDDSDAPVHAIGGVADTASHIDDQKFVQAATTNKAIGLSLYDFRTTASYAWYILQPRGPG